MSTNENKKLVIISNEKIFKNNEEFYCENIDMKSIPEELEKNFEVILIGRKSRNTLKNKINIKKIKISSSIFVFLFNIVKNFKNKKNNYLLISITPFNFLAFLILFIFRKRIFVYLRSSGHEEYKAIFGKIGPLIYHFMYVFVTFGSQIITCQERLVKGKKSTLVFPSELDDNWLHKRSTPLLDKPRILYVGRIKKEKGIFSLVKLIDQKDTQMELSIVGNNKKLIMDLKFFNKIKKLKINFLGYISETPELIKTYDNHNIIILPSYTEAHPKVIDESLARFRPVIVFEEIKHVLQNKSGVFVVKRDFKSLLDSISYIMSNYQKIQKNMEKNKLPLKKEFFSQMKNILSSN